MDGRSQNRKSLNGLTNISADDISVDTLEVDTISINNITLNNGVANKYVKTDSNKKLVTTTEQPVLTTTNQTIGGNKTFSNTIQGSVSGNAGSSTILATSRNIAGQSFDGSADISIASTDLSNTGNIALLDNTQTFSGTKTFSNTITGNISGSSTSCSGNASTATQLQTARNIAGQSFDGSADISIASTDLSNTSNIALLDNNQTFTGTKTFSNTIIGSISGSSTSCSGNASTATQLQTARNIAGQSFDGSADISIASTDLSNTSNIALLDNNQTFTGTKTFESTNEHEVEPTEISYDLVYGAGSGFSGTAPSLFHSGSQMWFRSKTNNNETQYHFATMLSADSSYGQTGYLRMDIHSTEGVTFNAIGKNFSSSAVPDMGFLSQKNQYNFHGGSGNRIYIDCSAFEIAKYSSGVKQSNGITFNGNLTGNAGSVTNGVYTTGDQTIGGNKTFSNTITGNISGSSGSTTGNALTATTLQTARNIAGQSFDGSADIDIASTNLSDSNDLIRDDDERLTKISTTSSTDQFNYTFDLSSTNKTYQTYNFKGNNNFIAIFDINQSMIYSDFAMVSGKKFLYPTGTANQFLKLDSNQYMETTTIASTDLTDTANILRNNADIECGFNDINNCSQIEIPATDDTQTFRLMIIRPFDYPTSALTYSPKGTVTPSDQKFAKFHTNRADVWFSQTSSDNSIFGNVTLGIVYGTYAPDTSASVNYQGRYWFDSNGLTLNKFYDTDLYVKSPNFVLDAGKITSTDGVIDCDNDNILTAGRLTSSGITSSGETTLTNNDTLQHGIKIKDQGTSGNQVPIVFGFSPERVLEENGTMVLCSGSSTSSRRFKIENQLSGGAFLRIKNSEGEYAWGCNGGSFYIFDYTSGLTRYLLNSSGNHDFYSGDITTLGNVSCADLTTTGTISINNLTTTGTVECGGLLSYTTGTDRTFAGGTTDIFDTTSGQRGMRIRNVTGSNIPILIGDTGLTDAHSETGTIVKFNFSSTSTRRVQMKNDGSGAFFLKLSNNEHTYGLGTDDSNYEIYDYDANAFRYKIDSSGHHDFYSGHITTLGYGYFGSNVYLQYDGSNTLQLNTFHNTGYTYSRIYAKQPSGGGRQVRLYIMIETTATVLYRISQTLFYTNIYVSGDIDYTGDIADVSDERTKENIHDANIDNIYENVKQIQLVNFNHTKTWSEYINKPYITKPQLGVISQQLEAINPDWVNTKKDDDKEHPNPEFEDLKLVKTNQLLYSSLASIQKLMQKIETLEARIVELEKK